MFVFLHIDMILMEAAALLPGPLASPSHTPMHHADAAIAGQHAGLPASGRDAPSHAPICLMYPPFF